MFPSTVFAALLHLHLTLALPQTTLLEPRASSGCNKPAFFPGLTQYRFNLQSSGKSRSYSYHLPSSYNSSNAYPVVLGFHGSSSIGAFFELDTKMSEGRYSGDKIMVYPNGIDGSWAGPSYHKNTSSTIQQDIQFVADVLTDVKSDFCVDESRVYGVGYTPLSSSSPSSYLLTWCDGSMSNGGGFIDTLACSPLGSTLFTALASHSGAFYTDINGPKNGCAPAKVVPMLEIHGAADQTVNYKGGKGDGGPLPSIESWVEWWAQRNKCSSKSEETLVSGKVVHQSWTCGGKVGLLQHYKVEDLGKISGG
jgi:poly(3-hydroxybutyrate) depolymerase